MQTLPTGRSLSQLPLFAPGAVSPRDVDLHAVSRPAGDFTGDFYFTHRHEDTLWLVVGDVSGKGLRAAVIMGMIQEELEHHITSCAATGCDPAVMMTRLDLFLRPILPGNRFATVAIAQIRDSGSLIVANGGHCPLLIARRDSSIETIGSTGPVVGILPSARWRSVEVPFRRGDTLLAYTDGVIEAQSGSGEEFGLCALQSAFAAAAAFPSAREIGIALSAAVHGHAGARRDDDLTMIVARR
jgi:serine phosphatase RsbU (regulator of sigma subunit)